MGNGGCGQFVTHFLCHSFPLTLFPWSSVGSISRETVLHELLQCESFPWAAILHELLHLGSLPQAAVLQEQAAPGWVRHRVTSPASKPAPAWAPLSTGTQVLPGACSGIGSPWAAASFRVHPLAPPWGPPQAAVWISALEWPSMGCRRISAPVPGALPPHPSSLTLVSAELFLSCIFTPVSNWSCDCPGFFPLFSYITEVLPPSLMGMTLASGRSIMELAGSGSIKHRGGFQQILTEASAVAPPATKTVPGKFSTLFSFVVIRNQSWCL